MAPWRLLGKTMPKRAKTGLAIWPAQTFGIFPFWSTHHGRNKFVSAVLPLANIQTRLVFRQVDEKTYTVTIRKTGHVMTVKFLKDRWVASASRVMHDWAPGKTPKQAFQRMISLINAHASF